MSKGKSPAFQWYPKDILSSQRVALMDLKTECAYRRAIDFCWIHGSLPKDLKKLSKIIGKGCTQKMAQEVSEMFYTDGDFLKHERLDREKVKQQEFSEQQRERVKKRYKKESTDGSTAVVPYAGSTLHIASTTTYKENNIKEISEKHKNFALELIGSDSWLEAVAMKTKLPIERIKGRLLEFIPHLTSTGEDKQNLKEFQSHFTHWIMKKPNDTPPSKIQFTL